MDILSFAMGRKAGGGGGGDVPKINDEPASPSIRVSLSDALNGGLVGADISDATITCSGFSPTDVTEIQIVFVLYDTNAGVQDTPIAIGSYTPTGSVLSTYCSDSNFSCPSVSISASAVVSGEWNLDIQIDQTEAENLGYEWHVLSIGL